MSQTFKFPAFALGLFVGIALTMPASAEPVKESKQKKQVVARNTKGTELNYRGQDKFRAGPLYYGKYYLGDDPDPFIRSQIQRDLGARFPGND